MDATNRWGPAPSGRSSANATSPPAGFSLNQATEWAFAAGGRLARARAWIEEESFENYTLTTLSVVFGLGAVTGWLIKRR